MQRLVAMPSELCTGARLSKAKRRGLSADVRRPVALYDEPRAEVPDSVASRRGLCAGVQVVLV
jgi:hypothetical protein